MAGSINFLCRIFGIDGGTIAAPARGHERHCLLYRFRGSGDGNMNHRYCRSIFSVQVISK